MYIYVYTYIFIYIYFYLYTLYFQWHRRDVLLLASKRGSIRGSICWYYLYNLAPSCIDAALLIPAWAHHDNSALWITLRQFSTFITMHHEWHSDNSAHWQHWLHHKSRSDNSAHWQHWLHHKSRSDISVAIALKPIHSDSANFVLNNSALIYFVIRLRALTVCNTIAITSAKCGWYGSSCAAA
jgi:hypothetical protein